MEILVPGLVVAFLALGGYSLWRHFKNKRDVPPSGSGGGRRVDDLEYRPDQNQERH